MGDVMGLSLDEIIKKGKIDRKTKGNNTSGLPKSAPPRKNIGARRFSIASENRTDSKRKPKPVVDARLKIIEKNRSKIVDARDKLVELTRAAGDVRQRLVRKGLGRGGDVGSGFAPVTSGNGVHKGMGHQSRRQQYHQKSSGIRQARLMDHYGMPGPDELDSMEIDDERLMHGGNIRVVPISSLKRTVLNESYNMPISMPPLPTFRAVRQSSPPSSVAGWMSDPFECYEPIRRPNLQAALPPSVRPAHPPYEPSAVRPRSNIRSTSTTRRPTSPLAGVGGLPPELLSSTMRARLERAPNPAESMGIFAKMPPDEPIYSYKPATFGAGSSYGIYSPAPASPPRAVASGFRIIVSNLHHNVTQQDIKELFEDVGDLLESRLVRTGVAEVIYRTLGDAEKAVDAYHNRQLDGQPMNCLLVHPRSSKPISSAIKYGSSGTTLASAVPTTSRAVTVRSSVATIPPGKSLTTSSSNNFGGNSNSGGGSGSGRGPGGTNKPDRTMEIDIDTLHSVLFRRKY
ncbi:uncharacterized protein LOC126569486 [Anopheles aquasalis]|uniref:uncharacterized protein LOC126569486 n=1 Tax=Anopheles aquasalis TaxID=42839 RepID=UPI00215AE643|nr:uncharacterized protein LOC126569486 [Anopheles aquasalis]